MKEMKLSVCSVCSMHYHTQSASTHVCAVPQSGTTVTKSTSPVSIALLLGLGLGLGACGDKDGDSGNTDDSADTDTVAEPNVADLYGVAQ